MNDHDKEYIETKISNRIFIALDELFAELEGDNIEFTDTHSYITRIQEYAINQFAILIDNKKDSLSDLFDIKE